MKSLEELKINTTYCESKNFEIVNMYQFVKGYKFIFKASKLQQTKARVIIHKEAKHGAVVNVP